jgi:hypothetical protein
MKHINLAMVSTKQEAGLLALFQDAPYVPFAVQDGNDFETGRLWSVHNGVFG